MLNDDVQQYANKLAQKEALEAELSILKERIISNMGSDKEFVSSDGTTAKIIEKETFKYTDELAMINWCKSNGYNSLVKETIVSTAMNKELKKGLSLTESLRPMFIKTVSYSLTVKKA